MSISSHSPEIALKTIDKYRHICYYMDIGDDMLKVKEVAQRLGISQKTVWRWIKDDKLKVYRLGEKTIRIDEKDLETFMAGTGGAAGAGASDKKATGTDSRSASPSSDEAIK
jgi:excisionase family DNA binding protein